MRPGDSGETEQGAVTVASYPKMIRSFLESFDFDAWALGAWERNRCEGLEGAPDDVIRYMWAAETQLWASMHLKRGRDGV